MKRGAFDYITKPFKNDEVLVVLRMRWRSAACSRRTAPCGRPPGAPEPVRRDHRPQPMHAQVFDLIIQAAPSRTTILIDGESGTGKSWWRGRSTRTRAPIGVHHGELRQSAPTCWNRTCSGTSRSVHRCGLPQEGLFELADKGDLFRRDRQRAARDPGQAAAGPGARVHAARGVETIKVDVQIVAATNVDLRRLTDEGRFREDLYYRLHVITVQLPALRDRKDDIPLLVQHFIESRRREPQAEPRATPDALDPLMEYDWPGNVRELQNVIERAAVLSVGSRIDVDLVARAQQPPFPDAAGRDSAGGHFIP